MIRFRATRAFTLLETGICIAIVAVVAALLTPALVRVKANAQISASMSNLRQIFVAVKLYQADYGGDGVYGSAAAMGLPDMVVVAKTRLGLPRETWLSPCGPNPKVTPPMSPFHYNYSVSDSPEFEQRALKFKENLVLAADLNCNDADVALYSEYVSKRALILLLSGRVLNRFAPGDIRRLEWWSLPSD